MADLSIDFAGVRFKNPIWISSAEPTKGLKNTLKAIRSGAGGVVLKSVIHYAQPPKIASWKLLNEAHEYCRGKITKTYTLYSRGGAAEVLEEWLETIKEKQMAAKENGVVLIGSIMCGGPTDFVARTARTMEQNGIKIIELDLSCPGAALWGSLIAQDEKLSYEVVKAATQSVSVPVVAKLTPQVADVVQIARAVKNAGAAAVTLTNRFGGFLVDIEQGVPYNNGKSNCGGPWVKPLTLRWVYEVYTELGIPISGSNGSFDWKDAVSFMMSGATTVQHCTVVLAKGYGVIGQIVQGVSNFLDIKGYGRVKDIIGIAAEAAVPAKDRLQLPQFRAVINRDLCTGCKICEKHCFFAGVRVENKVARVTESCVGCGFCLSLCPVEGAVSLEAVPEDKSKVPKRTIAG